MRARIHRLTLWTLAALFLAIDGSAEETWSGMAACRKITGVAERAACYDRAYDAIAGTIGEVSPEARFGQRDVSEREERTAERRGERIRELVATVTEVRRRPDHTHVVTLDNGQVWAESSVDHGFRVAVGERVKIEAAALGSYLMITPAHRSTRVTRLH